MSYVVPIYKGEALSKAFCILLIRLGLMSRTDSACLVFTGYHVKDTKPCYHIMLQKSSDKYVKPHVQIGP